MVAMAEARVGAGERNWFAPQWNRRREMLVRVRISHALMAKAHFRCVATVIVANQGNGPNLDRFVKTNLGPACLLRRRGRPVRGKGVIVSMGPNFVCARFAGALVVLPNLGFGLAVARRKQDARHSCRMKAHLAVQWTSLVTMGSCAMNMHARNARMEFGYGTLIMRVPKVAPILASYVTEYGAREG